MKEHIKGFLFGTTIGDALGVPVEFMSRSFLKRSPVVDMRSMGTHCQLAGTWSDDTSLTFCLTEQIIEGYNLEHLSEKICKWYTQNYWSARGEVFDIGISTKNALDRLLKGTHPAESGEKGEYSNGNGSLMRILPLVFYLKNKSIEHRFKIIQEVSGITHAHIRSQIACFFAVELSINLYKGLEKAKAYLDTQNTVRDYINTIHIPASEKELFIRIFYDNITQVHESEIYSSGYSLHTLEASLWAFLTTDSYSEAVLKAVNLGDDSDTTGCLTGGFAGLYYGFDAIPQEWIAQLARKDDIMDLSERLTNWAHKQ
ncbi:ADP-ribosylglycohydrolase [Pseudarcicella hirudinis]|uniref:ADP-ribosylglycohydrolase n=1 Tax=Pseudarcicella hirudinis TaxID=1079859 RepID=A0A1I5YJX4_9BACT|nr:ADP-ribosylglycohydrolase family protein [Pseudarcicella hirudinis]SFQ44529.1 ADP-ribosylglycohydrolase [Pseudarcicella hirudinis]